MKTPEQTKQEAETAFEWGKKYIEKNEYTPEQIDFLEKHLKYDHEKYDTLFKDFFSKFEKALSEMEEDDEIEGDSL